MSGPENILNVGLIIRQFPHTVYEILNIRRKLRNIGHPYGLLLLSSPIFLEAQSPLSTVRNHENVIGPDLKPRISRSGIAIGCFSTTVLQYRDKKPYVIKNDGGLEVATVPPGQTLLVCHVNRNASFYSQMEPNDRIKAIKNDFIVLCRLLNKPEEFNLTKNELEIVKQLQESPILGISHLVRLLSTKLLTWGIDPLPILLKKLHSFNIQLVSKTFGKRDEVNPKNIRVMFILADIRRQLIA